MLNIPHRRSKKNNADINIIPYIDVMLVLLVIFMMTTPIIEQGIEIDLPKSSSSKLVDFSSTYPTTITIDSTGKYYINSLDNEENEKKQSLQLTVLTAMLKARLEVYPNMQIFIRSDKNINYGKVIHLISFLQQHGINKVGLITDTINKK